MFLRLLTESFRRQKRRKALAAAAILLGTTAVTAMLALATTIGDRIHQELAVYGANIIVTPKSDTLDVNIGGLNLKPATGNTYLHESDLAKLQTIFWHNNVTAVSPELTTYSEASSSGVPAPIPVKIRGLWLDHPFGKMTTGIRQLDPSFHLQGRWPVPGKLEVALGQVLAQRLHLQIGDTFSLFRDWDTVFLVTAIVNGSDNLDDEVIVPLKVAQAFVGNRNLQTMSMYPDAVDHLRIAARTRPEDAFARRDPDSLSPKQRDLWYCRPYANSIAYQIQEAIPNSTAQQVRKVEQSEGTVLSRISGLMWLISAAALLAAGFAVSAAMATAVLERRTEIGLMRSLGSSRATVAALFYSESAILAAVAGSLGFVAGSALAWLLGRSIFPGEPTALFNPVLLPAILTLGILVAIAGSTPAIRAALNANPSQTLRSTD